MIDLFFFLTLNVYHPLQIVANSPTAQLVMIWTLAPWLMYVWERSVFLVPGAHVRTATRAQMISVHRVLAAFLRETTPISVMTPRPAPSMTTVPMVSVWASRRAQMTSIIPAQSQCVCPAKCVVLSVITAPHATTTTPVQRMIVVLVQHVWELPSFASTMETRVQRSYAI